MSTSLESEERKLKIGMLSSHHENHHHHNQQKNLKKKRIFQNYTNRNCSRVGSYCCQSRIPLPTGKHKVSKDYLSSVKGYKREEKVIIKETTSEHLRSSDKRMEYNAGSRDQSSFDTPAVKSISLLSQIRA